MNIFYYAKAFVHSIHTCFLLSCVVPAGSAERGHTSPCSVALSRATARSCQLAGCQTQQEGVLISQIQYFAGAGIKAVSSKELFHLSFLSSCTFRGDSAVKTGLTKGRSPIPVLTTQKDGFQVLIV